MPNSSPLLQRLLEFFVHGTEERPHRRYAGLPLHTWLVMLCVLILTLLWAGPAWADAQFAADQGCYGCHGNPPRQDTPSFARLAERYAPLRDQPDAQRRAADKLRGGSFLHPIGAHERLSPADAERLIAWLANGAR